MSSASTVLLKHGPQCRFSSNKNEFIVLLLGFLTLWWLITFSFLISSGESHQQTIHSIQDRVPALQGDNVTLSCNYTSATYFFWYRQYPSSPPQFLIKEYMELSGFTLKKDSERKVFDLEISSAAVTDSALYYCAVEPTVTGNTDSPYKNLTRNLKSICHRLKLWFRGGTSGEVNLPWPREETVC